MTFFQPPQFWQDDNAYARALAPLGRAYAAIVAARLKNTPSYTAMRPVLCVGNVTHGGTGKTPVVRALVKILNDAGKTPGVLLRGYGGRLRGPLWVHDHTARDVGDEALLHAGDVPTMVARDRAAGARVMCDGALTHIIMDDGLQNPSLKKDVSFLVVDGETGFGNNRVFPAGPLREPVESALLRVNAVVIMGPDKHNIAARLRFLMPVFFAEMVMDDAADLAGKPVVAFAGIGRPQKFFDALAAHDAILVKTYSFADHQKLAGRDIDPILELAARAHAYVVTTRKDWVRLPPDLRARVTAVDAHVRWHDEGAVKRFLAERGML